MTDIAGKDPHRKGCRCRDCTEEGEQDAEMSIVSPELAPTWPTATAQNLERVTVVHELGWQFGWSGYTPNTIMQIDHWGNTNLGFSAEQVNCFRTSIEIEVP